MSILDEYKAYVPEQAEGRGERLAAGVLPTLAWGMGILMVVGAIYGLRVSIAEKEHAVEHSLTQAPQQAQALLTALGTPAQGAIACHRLRLQVYCQAGVGDTVLTLACAATCHVVQAPSE